ncbi:MAG: CDP-diacylglycerol--serine O-phosphatidyltransferase [Bacteroidetes bacterium]|nr:MAG: CDP-diacylglycerol--serine O-phosphatidyltransferase [Bacteroidota bacterium]
MKKHIPNFITLINLFCGCCALANIFYGQFVQAFWFFLAGGIADYLDGMIARKMKINTSLGKELDSMADMVSFGVVPGAIFYMLLTKGFKGAEVLPIQLTFAAAPAFLVSVFAGLRLARFNLDTRQTDHFIGLNTPAATIFAVGLMLIFHYDTFGLAQWVTQPALLYTCIAALSYLLVAEIPMFNFKFKHLRWKGNEIRFIFAALALGLLICLKEAALSLIILSYILFSLGNNLIAKKA